MSESFEPSPDCEMFLILEGLDTSITGKGKSVDSWKNGYLLKNLYSILVHLGFELAGMEAVCPTSFAVVLQCLTFV